MTARQRRGGEGEGGDGGSASVGYNPSRFSSSPRRRRRRRVSARSELARYLS